MRTIGSTVLGINEGHQIESTWLEINSALGENLDKAFGKASFFLEAHTTFFLRIRCDWPEGPKSHDNLVIFMMKRRIRKMAASNLDSVNSFSIRTGVLTGKRMPLSSQI